MFFQKYLQNLSETTITWTYKNTTKHKKEEKKTD